MTMIGRNPDPEPEDDTEYVGDPPQPGTADPMGNWTTGNDHITKEPALGDWLVEVSVTSPDGRRVTSEAWFPEPTMTPRTIGEYLQAAAENVRSRVNSLP